LPFADTPDFTWTPAATLEQALGWAADEFRLQAEYVDNWGETRVAQDAVRQAVLRALGVPVDSLAGLNAFLEARVRARWARLLPEMLVTGAQPSPGQVSACAPAGTSPDARLRLWICLEDGTVESGDWRWGDLAVTGTAVFGGERFERRALQFYAPVPYGYHELRGALEGDPERGTSMQWIAGPDECWQAPGVPERMAGLAITLYGLRSDRNWGVGDFTDLGAVCEWAARELGVAMIGLNPLHAIHNRQPFNTSPYLPVSAYFRNPIYLDIEAVPELAHAPRAQALLRDLAVRDDIAQLRASEMVEYERVWRLKLEFLRLAFQAFEEAGAETARRQAFEARLDEPGGLLRQFATYCALDAEMHRRDAKAWNWPDWPAEYQAAHSPETAALAQQLAGEVRFHAYLQFLVDEQLQAAQARALGAGMRLGLYHDLALATDRGGCDTWSMPGLFVRGCRVGSPPDSFSPEGQDWSFPPPNDEGHARDGYRAFRELIRKNARHGGALRFDHVMRFFRLFWIPDGFAAREGLYVQGSAEAFLRVLALESHRGRFLVIGEDLGTVTGEIRKMLDQFGVLGYRLLYFERNGESYRRPDEYPRQAVAAITTHDLPTFEGFWAAADIAARQAAGLLPDEESYETQMAQRVLDQAALTEFLAAYEDAAGGEDGRVRAAVRCLGATPCRVMMISQEELTADAGQQNLPGSTSEHPNWRRKLRTKIENFATEKAFTRRVQAIHGILREAGRA